MLFFEREPAGKNISVKRVTRCSQSLMHVKQSLVHAIFTSHTLSTVYLINMIQVAAFLDLSGDGSSGCNSCIYTGIFCLCRLG